MTATLPAVFLAHCGIESSAITRIVSGFSPDTPKEPHVIDRPVQQPTPPDCSRAITTSRLEVIKRRQQTEGISEETSQLLAAGWSRGTTTTYQSAWKRWNSWCSGWQINPISCSIQSFLEFLTSIFKGGSTLSDNQHDLVSHLNDP